MDDTKEETPQAAPEKKLGRPKDGPKPWPTKHKKPSPKKPAKTDGHLKGGEATAKKLCKLDDPTIQKLLAAVRAGNHLPVAAAFAGISKMTLWRWLKKGAERHPGKKNRYAKLADLIQQAMAEAEVRDVATVAKASGAGDWKAAAWMLERRSPKRWGRKDKLTVNAKPTEKDLGLEVNVIPANVVDRKTGHIVDAEVRQLEPGKEEE